ncbi:MAG: hypothetical protein E7479_03170 [Ruminococcaceae bacterium]|nr:hypothetical protein [Oscillospiraceae bacterium]
MKKLILILAIILAFSGCLANEPEIPENNPESPEIESKEEPEEQQKIFLPLQNFLEEENEYSDNAVVTGRRTEIPVVLPENIEESSSNVFPADFWPELVAEIRMDYPDFDPENPGWKAAYNFYAVDGTAGMLKINYYIGENIITDKAIIGVIENGVIVRLNYTNIDFDADEDVVRKKAENFLETTTQTKKIFEEDEEFLSEETIFCYEYPSGILKYVYQLYFLEGPEGEQVINNDYGCEWIVE